MATTSSTMPGPAEQNADIYIRMAMPCSLGQEDSLPYKPVRYYQHVSIVAAMRLLTTPISWL